GSMYTYDQLNKLAKFLKCTPKDFMPSFLENDKEVFYDKTSKLDIHDIREELTNIQSQAAAWALFLDVNESILDDWDSKVEKANFKKLKEIGDVLEAGNKNLLFPQEGKKSGLSGALQVEYKRLLKKGLAKKIDVKDK